MSNLTMDVATRTLALLDQRKARLYSDRKCFYVIPLEGRVMVVFDPNHVDTGKINDDFAHRLSTRLKGRLVVRTNSRGIFLQVANEIPKALTDLISIPLDLSRQPTPYHIPIGTATRGEMWINLLEGDSFLVAGSRGMGKTGELHGWIQALLHGGAVDVYGYDGKKGVEFARYVGRERFTLVTSLGTTLAKLGEIALERRRALLKSGYPSIADYNAAHPADPITPIALFVDEAALTNEEEKAGLVRIVERERDTGFYPILGTNRPQQEALLVKTNLVTRVCFAVPSWNASAMVLGMNGAEELPKIRGRGLIVFRAKVTEFQSLTVMYPKPNEEALQQVSVAEEPTELKVSEVSEVERLAESIREQWSDGMSKNRVAQLLGWRQYGGGIMQTVNAVIEYLTSSSTSTQNVPKNGVFEPVEG
ncbi:MAG: hypothetical protein HY865_09480 [Chloroflexi bacterium]|nr:hypothetical protein [Chloroflexota bacterium]